jgi:hypothetical protein
MPKAEVIEVRIYFDKSKPHSMEDEIRTAKKVARGIKRSVFFLYEFESIRVFSNGKVQRWMQVNAPIKMSKKSKQTNVQEYEEI